METKEYLEAKEITYKALQSFDSVEQMDAAIKQHKDKHRLYKSDLAVLDVISRYSCKYPGVSYLSKSKIAEQIGMVRRTVIRACERLEALGIIKQYETRRSTGDRRQSSNIIVIQPAEKSEGKPEETEAQKAKDTPESHGGKSHLKTPHKANQKRINTNTHIRDGKDEKGEEASGSRANQAEKADKQAKEQAGKRALKTGIPAVIFNALEPFFDAKGLYKVYGILLRAKASIDKHRAITFEEYGEEYVNEFYNVIRKYKLGQVRNLKGLLFSAWQKVTSVISLRIGARNSDSTASMFMEVMNAC